MDGQGTQAKCGDGNWNHALTAHHGDRGRWKVEGGSMYVGISSAFSIGIERGFEGLSEASRDLREALVPEVEVGGAGREWMSENMTRKSEDLNDNVRQPPPIMPLKACG